MECSTGARWYIRYLFFIFFCFVAMNNYSARAETPNQQVTFSVSVFDHYTMASIDSALVYLMKQGTVIDSVYTNMEGKASFSLSLNGIDTPYGLPESISIGQNYPNPFNSSTTIEIGVPEPQNLLAEIYNMQGQCVSSGRITLQAGFNSLNLSLGHLPPGNYFLRLTGNESKSAMLVKTGSALHDMKRIFSINKGLVSNQTHKIARKKSGEEYTIRVSKRRYPEKVITAVINEGMTIEAPMQRLNTLLFVAQNDDAQTVLYNLRITGADTTFVLTCPDLAIIKSGIYRLTGSINLTRFDEEIEVNSRDSTIYFIPGDSVISPQDEYMPSGIELIDEALENGDIDEETALIYKIFYAFNDDRLPAAYAGGFGTGDFRTSITKKAAYLYESLSPDAQLIIGPFLVPPIYKGSWWDLKRIKTTKWWQFYLGEENTVKKSTEEEVLPCVPGMNCDILQPGDYDFFEWDYVANDRIKLWYQKHAIPPGVRRTLQMSSAELWNASEEQLRDHARESAEAHNQDMEIIASSLLDNIADKSWEELSALGLKQPFADHLDPRTGQLIENHGGDPRLDIYLLTQNIYERGLTISYTGRNEETPVFVLLGLQPGFMGPDLFTTAGVLIHEMMHTFQYAYLLHSEDPKEYEWFMESSANWAIDHIAPGLQLEHRVGVRRYLETPHLSLNDTDSNRHHSYLWPLFLSKEHYPGLIKDIIENFEIHPSLEATDMALKDAGKGGFEEQWPGFVLSLLNFEPYDQLFQWDQLSRKVQIKEEKELQLENATEKIFKIELEELEPLSSVYYRFLVKDDDISSFLFANGYSMSLDREEMEGIGLIRMGTKPEQAQKEGRNVQMLLNYKNRGWEPGPFESIDVSDAPGAILLEEEDGDRLEEVIIVFSNSSIDQKAAPINLPPEIEISNYANYKWEGEANMAAVNSEGITETVDINNIQWIRTDLEGYGAYSNGEEQYKKNTEFGETRFPLFLSLGYDLVSAQVTWNLSGQREEGSMICTYSGSDSYNVDNTAMESGSLNNLITLHHIYEEAESHRSFFHSGYQSWPLKTVSYTKQCIDQTTGETTTTTEEHVLTDYLIYSHWLEESGLPVNYADDDGRTITIEITNNGGCFGDVEGTLQLRSPPLKP